MISVGGGCGKSAGERGRIRRLVARFSRRVLSEDDVFICVSAYGVFIQPLTQRPFSSVVERATRNGEVGCSIQPMGIQRRYSVVVITWDSDIHFPKTQVRALVAPLFV